MSLFFVLSFVGTETTWSGEGDEWRRRAVRYELLWANPDPSVSRFEPPHQSDPRAWAR